MKKNISMIKALCSVIVLTNFALAQTTGGNGDGLPCLFPFVYAGMAYTTCIDIDHDKPWCSITEDYDKDKRWGECMAEDLEHLPSFDTSTPQNVTVYQGDTVRLKCTVNNLQNKKVSWQLKGSEYPLTVSTFSFLSSGRFQVEHEEPTQWNLILKNARLSDGGTYQCRITTQTMLLVREVHLTVQEKPPTSTPVVTLGERKSYHLEKGDRLQLICKATSNRSSGVNSIPPEVEWFKDGNKLDPHAYNQMFISNRVETKLRISTLTIEKTGMDDAGIYVCRTTDKENDEVAVRILNVDKENKKRGTDDMPAVGKQQSDESSAAPEVVFSFLLLSLLLLHLT